MSDEEVLVECSLCGVEMTEDEHYSGTMFDVVCVDCGVTLDDMYIEW